MAGIRQIASAAGVVSVATMCSRVLGFVRDMALAWLFGTSDAADAFFAAFRIPSTLRELLGEGSLSAAFIPTFSRTIARDGRDAAWRLVSAVMGTLVVLLILVTIGGVVFAPILARVLAHGFAGDPEKLALTGQLLRIMFPYLFFVGLAALFMAMLNSLGHFLTPALSPVMLNLAMITGIVLAARSADHSPVWVAAAVLVGGACQILFQIPAALRHGWRPRLRFAPNDPGVRHMGALMLPGVPSLAATQVNVLVNLFLASFLASGSVAAITYAFRLVQFPIGTLAVPIATGALPVFARSFASGQLDEMKQSLRDSLRLAIFVTLPAMAGLIVFAAPMIAVLLEYGTFGRASTLLTASALMAYGTGLLFYVANRILAPAFFAMHDTWTPASSAMVGVAVNILVSLALLRPLGIVGLALATAAASAANCALLVARLRGRVGGIGGRRVVRTAALAALACVPLVVWGLLAPAWLDVLSVSSKAVRALYLAAQLAVAVGLYLGTAALLKSEELRWAVELLSRKKRRASV